MKKVVLLSRRRDLEFCWSAIERELGLNNEDCLFIKTHSIFDIIRGLFWCACFWRCGSLVLVDHFGAGLKKLVTYCFILFFSKSKISVVLWNSMAEIFDDVSLFRRFGDLWLVGDGHFGFAKKSELEDLLESRVHNLSLRNVAFDSGQRVESDSSVLCRLFFLGSVHDEPFEVPSSSGKMSSLLPSVNQDLIFRGYVMDLFKRYISYANEDCCRNEVLFSHQFWADYRRTVLRLLGDRVTLLSRDSLSSGYISPEDFAEFLSVENGCALNLYTRSYSGEVTPRSICFDRLRVPYISVDLMTGGPSELMSGSVRTLVNRIDCV